ncbi:MAG: hypothetical protein J5496_00850 [Lachnospiraceae bacterium]|nr:hypothetical protein [Lachnospiraceae bacterium]
MKIIRLMVLLNLTALALTACSSKTALESSHYRESTDALVNQKETGAVKNPADDSAATGRNTESTDPMQLAIKEDLNAEACMRQATHLIDAVYLGLVTDEYGSELLFQPVKTIKGELEETDWEGIYVTLSNGNPYAEESAFQGYFIVGRQYFLCLNKFIAVTYAHPKFGQVGGWQISEAQPEWEEYHRMANRVAEEAPAQENVIFYGNPFLTSGSAAEVMDFASNVFVLIVEQRELESRSGASSVYRCKVEKALRNTPVTLADGNILLTLPNGLVTVGETYVVLLADCRATAPVYTLAAKENAVFSVTEALTEPALSDLLQESGLILDQPY